MYRTTEETFLLTPWDSTLDYKPGRVRSRADAPSHLQRKDNGVPWGQGWARWEQWWLGKGEEHVLLRWRD